MKLLVRTASDAYFALVESALSIPPLKELALRDAGKVAVFEPSTPEKALGLRCAVETAAEPVALGLTPDEGTLLVSSGWGHALGAFDAASLDRRFEVDLPREPRAVVIGDDGKTAFVSHAVGARMSAVDLAGEAHAVKDIPLQGTLSPIRSPDRSGISSCQGYALARSLVPGGRVLAPQVLVTPGDPEQRAQGYGDENTPTEQPSVAVIDEGTRDALPASLQSAQEQRMFEDVRGGLPQRRAECLLPRAAAVDPGSRTLFVTCFGIDAVIAYDASAASPALAEIRRFEVGSGPSGIAVDAAHARAVVWSQFDRSLGLISLEPWQPMHDLAHGAAAIERVSLAPTEQDHALAVGRQPDLFKTGAGLVEQRALACDRAPETEAAAHIRAALDGQRHIVERREAEENICYLIGTRHAGGDSPVHGEPGHVTAGKMHAAAVRLQGARYMVDEGRLAGAVGSDQGMDVAAADAQVHVLHGGEAAELLGQTLGVEDEVVCHAAPHSMAEIEPTRSRSWNFWILPVEVFGSSTKTTRLGTLKRAS